MNNLEDNDTLTQRIIGCAIEVHRHRLLSPFVSSTPSQETLSIEAQSADVATPTSSICNAEGERFLRSPEGPVPGRPQGVVAGSLCAEGTPPRPRLALWPARHRRGHAFSVNRP